MPTYELWGHSVDIEIPKDIFPTDEVLKEYEETFNHPEHGYFTGTYQDKKLHYRKYLPTTTPPKAVVIYAHGIHGQGGYGMQKKGNGQYTQVALRSRLYPKSGFALYVPDMLGHGFSEGKRFYVPNWQVNRDDLVAFAKFVAKEHPDVPMFLSGESYGGSLTLHAAHALLLAKQEEDDKKTNIQGIVLNCPAIVGDLPPLPVIWLLRYGLAPLFPLWTPSFMPHPVSAERIWKDEESHEIIIPT
mmetsp:Transcript_13389/g.20761  ORF Transcript_13389/g.20761 Transcript_13389/m.20761 type:complete len:244 (+) Transcript_13389:87-818(+)